MYQFTQMGPTILALHLPGLGFLMFRDFHCFSTINRHSSLILTYQNWIMDLSDSSKFKVFWSVLNLSDQINLVFLIQVLWMVSKTYTIWRIYRSLKCPVSFNFWNLNKFDLDWEKLKREYSRDYSPQYFVWTSWMLPSGRL